MSPNVGHIAPIIGSEAPKSFPSPIIATMFPDMLKHYSFLFYFLKLYFIKL